MFVLQSGQCRHLIEILSQHGEPQTPQNATTVVHSRTARGGDEYLQPASR